MKIAEIPELLYFDDCGNVNGICVAQHCFENYKPHRHVFYEFEYVARGEGECDINGKTYSLRAGDVSFLTPMDLHSYKGTGRIETVTVHFNLNNLSKELWGLSGLEACAVRCDEEMKKAFASLAAERETKDFKYISYRNLLERIVVLFLRRHRHERSRNIPAEIVTAIGFINQNFGEKLTLEAVSGKSGYSPEYFCRQFKKYIGIGFVDYLTDIRASHARNLLMSQDISVTQLCYECGFGSVRSLNRAFLKKYGCSPVEYKNQNSSV